MWDSRPMQTWNWTRSPNEVIETERRAGSQGTLTSRRLGEKQPIKDTNQVSSGGRKPPATSASRRHVKVPWEQALSSSSERVAEDGESSPVP